MGCRPILKIDAVPSLFECQGRKNNKMRPMNKAIELRDRKTLIEEILRKGNIILCMNVLSLYETSSNRSQFLFWIMCMLYI
jgi:hypothetical protein